MHQAPTLLKIARLTTTPEYITIPVLCPEADKDETGCITTYIAGHVQEIEGSSNLLTSFLSHTTNNHTRTKKQQLSSEHQITVRAKRAGMKNARKEKPSNATKTQ